ncbi:RidA family protein [Nonomuraea rhodomycinica]|uniref:RidA family protein n=1 Tax=Nonomuraea rhodomycinica TaxID=1712872 RepID=A0A7Y6MDQ6_9ACTN|nr:RidA family protein [Nonomuraea rhodomycinica]
MGVPHRPGADPQHQDDPGQLRRRRLGAGADRAGRLARAARRLLQEGEAVTPEQRLAELGLTLPEVVPPLAAYVPAVRTGDLVYTSGQVPLVEGKLPLVGKLGAELTVDEGREMARICALNALAALKSEVGDLGRVVRIVKAVVFVASDPGFTGQPQVANGASELLAEVLGEAGRHARSAVGVASLPLDAPVEVELIAEVS